jgi:hypothetical protein
MIIVNRMVDHEKHKASLLSKIDALTKKELWGQTLSMPGVYTDWKLTNANVEREYLEEFFTLIDPVMESIAKSLGFLTPEYLIRDYRFSITSAWFNQYLEGGEHDWHNHPGCQFTNCYYLELPDVEYATEVIGADGKLCKIHATEGDVMTCPAWMKHRSKPNGPGRKTIIAWNSNYEV